MAAVPQITRGYDLRYTVFLDVYWAVGVGHLTPDAVAAVFDACWEVCVRTAIPGLPLGLIRLTTIFPGQIGPWAPKMGLRSGEYVSVRFVPSLANLGGQGAGGYSPTNVDRNPTLYAPTECFVVVNTPPPQPFWEYLGRVVAHEAIGHTMMPSWGQMGVLNQHNVDPTNLLYGGPTPSPMLVTQRQVEALEWNLARVRGKGPGTGVRSTGIVNDGGIPAWPIPGTNP